MYRFPLLGPALMTAALLCADASSGGDGLPPGIPCIDVIIQCDCWVLVEGSWGFNPCRHPAPSPSPSPGPSPSPSPSPSPTPAPVPTATPTPSPSPAPEPTSTPEPSPSPLPSPTPEPAPAPVDCSPYKAVETGWSLLSCTVNSKLICGGGQGRKCDCSGAGCSFELPVGAVCHGDSTPRYNGELPNWKTCACRTPGDTLPCDEWPLCDGGRVERSEYPPKPASGWSCGATTVWSASPGMQVEAEAEGYGARLKFPHKGAFKVKACRNGSMARCTEKTARIK